MNKYWCHFIGSGKPKILGKASPGATLYSVIHTWTDLQRDYALISTNVFAVVLRISYSGYSFGK
jgi:hypothetical protein